MQSPLSYNTGYIFFHDTTAGNVWCKEACKEAIASRACTGEMRLQTHLPRHAGPNALCQRRQIAGDMVMEGDARKALQAQSALPAFPLHARMHTPTHTHACNPPTYPPTYPPTPTTTHTHASAAIESQVTARCARAVRPTHLASCARHSRCRCCWQQQSWYHPGPQSGSARECRSQAPAHSCRRWLSGPIHGCDPSDHLMLV